MYSGTCCWGESDSGEVEDYEINIGAFYTISGTVFEDSNEDGTKDSDENPLPNVKVGLYKDFDRDGAIDETDIVQEVDSDENGNYIFTVPPNLEISRGDYLVIVDTSDEDIPDNLKLNGANPLEATMNNENVSGKDFPFIEKSISIGDKVWQDSNRDGIQDESENGIADVNLILSEGDTCENVVATIQQIGNGIYLFDNNNVSGGNQ